LNNDERIAGGSGQNERFCSDSLARRLPVSRILRLEEPSIKKADPLLPWFELIQVV